MEGRMDNRRTDGQYPHDFFSKENALMYVFFVCAILCATPVLNYQEIA